MNHLFGGEGADRFDAPGGAGKLLYDADGSGRAGAVRIGTRGGRHGPHRRGHPGGLNGAGEDGATTVLPVSPA